MFDSNQIYQGNLTFKCARHQYNELWGKHWWGKLNKSMRALIMEGKYGEKWFTAPLLQRRDEIGPTVTAVFYIFFFPYICWARWTEAGSSRVTCTARKTAVPPAVLSQYSSCATHVVGYKGQLGASNKSEDCHKIRLFISMQCVFFFFLQQAVLNLHHVWGLRI